MKYSKQKDEILKFICSGKLNHPRAADVYLRMKSILPNIGIATVYRNLNALAEMGLVRRISIAGDADRFDHRLEAHNHAKCKSCDAVFDFNFDCAKDIEKILMKNYKFQIVSANYSVIGLCEKCARDCKK